MSATKIYTQLKRIKIRKEKGEEREKKNMVTIKLQIIISIEFILNPYKHIMCVIPSAIYHFYYYHTIQNVIIINSLLFPRVGE